VCSSDLEDLEAKIIRTVGNPVERFQEDALRIMRAVRFSAELGFIIENETSKAIYESADLLAKVSRERIRDEFVKILMSDNPMIGIVMLQKLGLLKHVSPALEGMVGVSQETQAHIYDVFEHSLRALQHSADKCHRLELRLAVLFHDIAKPHTKRMVGTKATFYGHEVVGAKVTQETLNDLKFSRETIDNVSRLVRWHMFFSDPDKITLSAVRRMVARVGEKGIWDLVELRKCDRIGTGRPTEEPYRFRKYQSMIEESLRAPINVGMLKVDGVKLMELGVEKGPRIGAILHSLLEEVLDDPERNTEEYLVTRVTELNKLSEKELNELYKKGKDRLEEEDDKVIQDLRKKHRVN
jgi:putative nucleotidyltransferase with HDIG domain